MTPSLTHRLVNARIFSTERTVSGRGNGIISSVLAALKADFGVSLEVASYSEHAIGKGSDVSAAAYVECADSSGRTVWGVGIDEDVATASVRAVLSAASAVAEGTAVAAEDAAPS